VPSFVNSAVALQDPLVRQRLTAAPEPTRLDLAAKVAGKQAPSQDPHIWYLRFRGEEGRWRKARATTAQILQRLSEGRITLAAEASHDPKGAFQPLNALREFRELGSTNGSATNLESNAGAPFKEVGKHIQKPAALRRPQIKWALLLGLMVFLTLGLVSYFLFF